MCGDASPSWVSPCVLQSLRLPLERGRWPIMRHAFARTTSKLDFRPSPSRRFGSTRTRCARSSGSGSRRSARFSTCPGWRWRGGFAEPGTGSVRRAGGVLRGLARALARNPEPLTAAPVDPPPRAVLRLEEPATHAEAGPQALEQLIPHLVRQLQERHLGARRVSVPGFRVDGGVGSVTVAPAIASREPKHLARL